MLVPMQQKAIYLFHISGSAAMLTGSMDSGWGVVGGQLGLFTGARDPQAHSYLSRQGMLGGWVLPRAMAMCVKMYFRM